MTDEADILEDGELVSSDEEDTSKQKDKDEVVQENKQVEDTNKPALTETTKAHDDQPMGTQLNIDLVSDEGELFSDDEESAYYPRKAKSRSSHQSLKELQDVRPTRWSAPNTYKQSSPTKSKVPGSRYRQSSPESDQSGSTNRSRRKRDRSESSDKDSESFFEDRDGSDLESKEKRISREKPNDNRSPRSSDHYGTPGSRDQDSKRDYHSSPNYKFHGNQERDSSSVGNEGDNSHHHQQRNYGWSRRGGYGPPTYQQGHTRYGRTRGGYGYKRFPSNQIGTGMTSKEFHALASQIVRRKEQGLSLLPAPRAPKYTHVDLSSYPPAPEWYLKDLQFWEKVQKKQKSLPMTNSETIPPASLDQVPSLFPPVPPSVAPMAPVPPTVAIPHFSPALPLALTSPPLFNRPASLGCPATPENYLFGGSKESCSIVQQESAHTFPPSVPSGNTPVSDQSHDDLKSAPLVSNMPFAQPLPSSYHPPSLLHSQADGQPLNPTTRDAPTRLSLPIDSSSISSVNDLACNATPTTPSNLTISMQPSEVSNSIPLADSANLQTDMPVNGALSVSHVSSSGSVARTSGTGFLERSMSVSSEVKMEIDAPEEDSRLPIDIPTFPTAVVPGPSEDSPCQTSPLQANPTSVLIHAPQTNTLPGVSHSQQVAETHTPSESIRPRLASLSASNPSLCNSQTDSEPIKYNLRPRASSSGPDSKPKRVSTTNVVPPSNVLDNSDNECDYDSYLDQLDDDEIPVAPALTTSLPLASLLQEGLPRVEPSGGVGVANDPFSEEFPLISDESSRDVSSNKKQSLMQLVGQDSSIKPSTDPPRSSVRITKRTESLLTWRAKQRQRAVAVANRQQETVVERPVRPVCKYYLNGMCKNGDSCLYRHEGTRIKKKEICKFYLQDNCNKGQDCMYYHGKFPCKFFHIKNFCKNGDMCKFSHAPLTPETDTLLLTVSDSVTPTSTMLYQQMFPPYPARPVATHANNMIHIQDTTDEGFQIKMFGSQEIENEHQKHLLVSIPKTVSDENQLIVSFPLSKLTDFKRRLPSVEANFPPGNNIPSTADPQVPLQPVPLFPSSLVPRENQITGASLNPPRKILLPTPPLHVKLTPDDFKKMETMPHEYWEAPGLSEPPGLPPGGTNWIPPYNVRFPPRPPGPPRYKQPFFRPPGPRAFPPRPPQHWNPPPQHGHPPWQSTGGPSNFNTRPVGMESRQGGMESRPVGMESRHGGVKPIPVAMEPKPVGMELRPGGIEPRPGVMELRPGGIEPRPGGMDPRQTGSDPRQSSVDPRYIGQDPRRSSSQASQVVHNQGGATKWGQQPSHSDTKPSSFQSGSPYSHPASSSLHGGGNHQSQPAFSPPRPSSVDRVSPVWSNNSLYEKTSPNWKPSTAESSSPVWGTSPDHPSSVKGGTDTNASRRLDPRKKYSHFKIKTKGSPQQPSSKRESDADSSSTGFKIPKLLKDTSGLDKPLDPSDLFGGGELGSQPYGEITIGNYTSPFSQHTEGGSIDSNPKDTQEVNCRDEVPVSDSREDGQESVKVDEYKSRTSPTFNEPQVPSYFAQIDMGLGGGASDLKIDSAFGSLSDKNKTSEDRDKMDDGGHARKLPSVFGFGL